MTSRMLRTRSGLVLVAAAALVLSAPGIAAAHAELEATAPADGATVVGTPAELSATFSEALTAESTLSIRNAAGERLGVGGLDPADGRRLVIAPAPELAPGPYEMRWSAFTDDGHLEKGTWTFEVEAPPASPTPTSAPTPVATDAGSEPPTVAPTPNTTPAATPRPSGSPDDGAPTSGSGDVILPIIAALAIVAIGGVLLLGRRGRTGAAG